MSAINPHSNPIKSEQPSELEKEIQLIVARHHITNIIQQPFSLDVEKTVENVKQSQALRKVEVQQNTVPDPFFNRGQDETQDFLSNLKQV